MLVNISRQYNVNKILLSHLGLWPSQSKFVRNLIPILYLVIHMTYFSLEVLSVCDHWGNMQLVFEILFHIVSQYALIVKLFNEIWNRDKIRCLYEAMENHWNIFTSEFELRILKNSSILMRKFVLMYSNFNNLKQKQNFFMGTSYCLFKIIKIFKDFIFLLTYENTIVDLKLMFFPFSMYSIIVLLLMTPLKSIFLDIIRPLNESRPLFFVLTMEWRIDKDKYFVPLFCYNCVMILTGVIITTVIDSSYIIRTIHACSLFSTISQQFEKIVLKPDINIKVSKCECCMNALSKSASEQVIYQKYVTCLRKYQLVLQYVALLNSMYQITALIILLSVTISFSLVGIQLIYMLGQLEELVKNITIFIGMLIQLMILCYPGQKLLDESQNLFYQVYAVEWYTFSSRVKSLMIITLHRSFVPCSLRAGNIIPLSMATFGTMIRAGLSYFMTLLSLKA